jgi:23S rRNA pseudouridine955/2504/2580 synthase
MPRLPQLHDLLIQEDEHLLFINKPSGIASLEDRNNPGVSILAILRRQLPDAQLCHRLDKETTGIMVVAKHNEAYREMAMMFENRKVNKVYHAVVAGQLMVEEKEINLPLAIGGNGQARVDKREGKPAITKVNTLKTFQHYTLLQCEPVTGRLHQIRAHLAAVHFPIAGDIMYGGKIPLLSELKRKFKTSKFENEQGMIKRVALHAFGISFQAFDRQYKVEAAYPKDFDVLVKILEKHDLA